MTGSQFDDIRTLMQLKITDAKQQHKNRKIALQEIAGTNHSVLLPW